MLNKPLFKKVFLLKKILFMFMTQLLIIVLCVGCNKKTGYDFSNWPYTVQDVYGSKIFVHNPTDGLLIDIKEKNITKLFDSEKVDATRVQGSTTVTNTISPDCKNIIFNFDGGDEDLIDKNKNEDQLRIYDIQSKKLKTLVEKGGYNAVGCWSKDSSKYIFSSDRLDSIYIYDVNSKKSEKVKRPDGKFKRNCNIVYIKDNYILCVIDNNLYQYSDNSWNKVLDNWDGYIYKNSKDNCYLIDKNQVSKLVPKTRQLNKVYSIPANLNAIPVFHATDMFAFINDTEIHVFDTLTNKEILFKVQNKLEDFPVYYISPNKDKILMRSYDDDKITVATIGNPTIYKYDTFKKPSRYPAGWYDNDSFILIDGENIKKPKAVNIKTQEEKNLIGW